MEIECTSDGVYSLSQSFYIDMTLKKFGMENAHGHQTPMDPNIHLEIFENDEEVDQQLYLSIVGSLMYASLGSRPDISFAVTSLSRFNMDPRSCHLTAAKRVLRYLKQTHDLKLWFDGSKNIGGNYVCGFTDSDWANDSKDRKSVGGYVFTLNGNPVSWQSKKQELVATSTMEAEFTAFLETCKEALWLRKLEKDISNPPNSSVVWLEELIVEINHDKGISEKPLPVGIPAAPTVIYSDNQAAIKVVKTEGLKTRTKHFDIRLMNSRDLCTKGLVNFEYINTKENLADIFTKALLRDQHQYFTKSLHLR
jgi:hypothetical protein